MVQKTLLSDTPENLIRRYVKLLRDSGIIIDEAILFGSYATKTNQPWSDVDVCVVSKQFGGHRLIENMDLAAMATRVDSMIEPHALHPDDLLDKFDPFVAQIKAHGIRIV